MRVLSLDRAERSAIADGFRRHQGHRVPIDGDLRSCALPEPDETDLPGITPQGEEMIDGHYGIAEPCRTLAEQLNADGAPRRRLVLPSQRGDATLGIAKGCTHHRVPGIAGGRLRERVAHLSERVYALAAQLEDQQHLLDGLRKATDR